MMEHFLLTASKMTLLSLSLGSLIFCSEAEEKQEAFTAHPNETEHFKTSVLITV